MSPELRHHHSGREAQPPPPVQGRFERTSVVSGICREHGDSLEGSGQ